VQEIGQAIIEAIRGLTLLEYFIFTTGLLYVIYAARNSWICWIWGLFNAASWMIGAFFQYQLYIDGFLQIYYLAMSVWGLWLWSKGGASRTGLPITVRPMKFHLSWIGLGLISTLAVGYVFEMYTDTAAPYPDAFTTVFSLLTTYLVVKRILENWIYWIVIDLVYIALYFSRGGYLLSLLFVIFCVVAITGFLKWRREYYRNETRTI
jgi:nicotinamide mononucleotide transporter